PGEQFSKRLAFWGVSDEDTACRCSFVVAGANFDLLPGFFRNARLCRGHHEEPASLHHIREEIPVLPIVEHVGHRTLEGVINVKDAPMPCRLEQRPVDFLFSPTNAIDVNETCRGGRIWGES